MSAQNENTADREIVLSRLLNAPRELVFEVWTNQKHVEQWWGPNGFSTTTHQMEVKPGGVWRFIMHGPDGTDYQNRLKFVEIDRPKKLVYVHDGGEDNDAETFHVTITFEERGGKTNLTMRSIFPTAAARDRVVKEYGAIEGGKQHLARLDQYLKTMRGASK
ncbi:SRPBCC domain-containing protein [Candidatus Acetothermia bacterium]|nr:SRPBCC domain-containing protein [Candidatus Acetothermia bacterium]MBI3643647.1 SRPBCC domain-containing protein [Candidatus Acetothermia bacterium]